MKYAFKTNARRGDVGSGSHVVQRHTNRVIFNLGDEDYQKNIY